MTCCRTPTILQLEATDCGAAALAMVLAFHGRWVPREALRQECGVSRDGSSAGALLRAARVHGLTARGFRLPPAALGTVLLPAILFVGLNHFVVLEGFSGDCVFFNDPASGRRRMQANDFAALYSGIVLTFEPTAGFVPMGRAPRLLPRLAAWRHGGEAMLAQAVAAGLGLTVFTLLVPGFSRIFIDDYLVDGQAHLLPWLVAVMLAAALLQGGLVWLRGALRQRLAVAIETRLGAVFLWRLLRLPVAFYDSRAAGSLAARASLLPEIGAQTLLPTAVLLVEGASAFCFLLTMAAYSPVLAAIAALTAAAALGALLLTRRHLAELSRQAAQRGTRLAARTMLGLQMIESLKAGGTESAFFAGWAGEQAQLAGRTQRIAWLQALLTALPALLAQLGTVAVLVIGGLLVMQGRLSFGMLVAVQLLQAAFNAPVAALLQGGITLQQAQGTVEQLEDVLAHPPAVEFDRTGEGTPGRHLALHGLAFGYGAVPLLRDLSLDLAPGARVAIVGASGSGKSTVGRLTAGLLEPWEGTVTLDGKPINSLPRAALRRSLAVVDQEIILFAGSLHDNIALWDDSLPSSAILAAAMDAEIHEAILARPGGYDAPVEEGGRNFSGGQRQRLEIARALATDPAVLVLDEATSALDPVVEQRVMANLRRRGCACLVIAHRLSTVRDCDEIILLDRGRVVERGTHDALMARRGAYASLVEA